ncbi:MAG TPA: DUF2867 domain-containing protein [Mycobacterium sp.]|nr:DUF2867 domain-containing protein [Mycobacterium sp.]
MVATKARLTREAHTSRPWRIHQIAPDFDVLDVWALPTPGGPNDFPRLVDVMRSIDAERSSPAVHALFAVRWALGRLFGWDGSTDGIDSRVTSLRERLPELEASSPRDVSTGRFAPLYVTDDEAALEIANRTMHGVMHLGWVPDEAGGHRGQMTILVRPNGVLGAGYLAAIGPFRHLVVYPAILRAIGRVWPTQARAEVTVRHIDPPQDLREFSTLPRVDYADAFLVQCDAPPDWTAERWARAMLEEAPAEMRAQLSSGCAALGLKSVTSAGSILGWSVRRDSSESLLLGRRSRIGMPGELLFAIRPEGLIFVTFVHHQTAATRPMWASVKLSHVRTVRTLLERAGRIAGASVVRESAGAG